MERCELGEESGQRRLAGIDGDDDADVDHVVGCRHGDRVARAKREPRWHVYAAPVSVPWRSTPIPGAFLTGRSRLADDRGSFTKILGEADDAGRPPFVTREVFWSLSRRGVFRGLHVQLPPREARKLVFVTRGVVRDFVLDLRRGSPTEGTVWETALDESTGGLLIPAGCAHGFEVLSEDAAMVYLQEDFFAPEYDAGVHFASVGIDLVAPSPVVSERDLSLPDLSLFDSPFGYP